MFHLMFLAVPCSDPTPTNGYITVVVQSDRPPFNGLFFKDTLLSYGCNPGFILSGVSVSICSPVGTWTPSVPSCIPQGSILHTL